MLIKSVRLRNYKSYWDSGPIEFQPGLNVITGKNSAGKTALLEALRGDFPNVPHRSLVTVPKEGQSAKGRSTLEFELHLTSDEAEEILPTRGQFQLPTPLQGPDDPLQSFLGQERIVLTGFRSPGTGPSPKAPGYGVNLGYPPSGDVGRHPTVIYNSVEGLVTKAGPSAESGSSLFALLSTSFFSSAYYFLAQRYNVARAEVGASTILSADARNLAEVLLNLSGNNPERFREYTGLVSEVFPEIEGITVAPDPNSPQHALIRVWFIDPKSKRSDLAFSLDQCGTGVSQVLAILYVVLTSIQPRVIVIDEPQSFLHPGAARKLLEILQDVGREHQYIISTHWPGAITGANASTVHSLHLEEMQTRVSKMDASQTGSLTRALLDLGVRLSDVFGADYILWVEGPTEEAIFPLIVEKMLKRRLGGIQILSVLHTGDFERRHKVNRRTIWQVYERISGGTALSPPALGFIFDMEGRDEAARTAFRGESRGQAHFLPRRMFENYLLVPEAIAHAISTTLREPMSAEAVANWLEKAEQDQRLRDETARSLMATGNAWISSVDAARLLERLFEEMTSNRLAFEKLRDSTEIARWLIDNKPEALREIADLLEGVLNAKPRGS